ncbi:MULTISPECIES: hypothetical protein [Actinopolyspora]|uniref:Uncharacterized protein n=1 Tax=Actinopolyspora saharensis TaxID=995062 RepID=A0A1H0YJT3_9ACTN|nr:MULTISPECIES: hypothetical protein [Actinopolyspora]NHD19539.1 hypothetical protein [Actinopolyspora sp. BKK2]NHE78713.1 hypothetical protein [Actinopolyspora sp. BKK1]SDQ15383.1 hypothetical protein SAMN04489718_0505 [Actinopolyspora saharensis]
MPTITRGRIYGAEIEDREEKHYLAVSHNRRSVFVTLSDEGRKLIDDVDDDHVRNERELLDAPDQSDQDRLADLLRTLLTGLGNIPEPHSESSAGASYCQRLRRGPYENLPRRTPTSSPVAPAASAARPPSSSTASPTRAATTPWS